MQAKIIAILFRNDGVGYRPADADVGIEPEDTSFITGTIEIRTLVENIGCFTSARRKHGQTSPVRIIADDYQLKDEFQSIARRWENHVLYPRLHQRLRR